MAMRTPLLCGLAILALPVLAWSAPCVQFDVPQTLPARDATTAEFSQRNPDLRLIELRFPISSLVRLGSEDVLLEYLHLISPTAGAFQVVDYAPRTTLQSQVKGSVSVETKRGSSSNLGIQAVTPQDFPVKGDASAAIGSNSSDAWRYQLTAPKQLIAASGTMQRGTSAYFKIKPSSQTTLEGDREFEIVAQVPSTWRGGLLRVQCLAFAKPRGVAPTRNQSEMVCGTRTFLVGAYLQGDRDARESVRKLAESQRQLVSLAAARADTIQSKRFPTLGHKIGAAFSMVQPRIPNQWLDRVLDDTTLPEFSKHLPQDVRRAVSQYDIARRAVFKLAGS